MPNVGVAMGPMGQPMFAGSGQQQFAPGMQFYPGQGMNPSMMSSMPGMAPAMFPMQVNVFFESFYFLFCFSFLKICLHANKTILLVLPIHRLMVQPIN